MVFSVASVNPSHHIYPWGPIITTPGLGDNRAARPVMVEAQLHGYPRADNLTLY